MYRYSTHPTSVYEWSFDTYNDGSHVSYYLGAYYQSFLMIVGNYQVPLNNSERILFIFIGILGVCMYAAIVGQMSMLVADMDVIAIRHR